MLQVADSDYPYTSGDAGVQGTCSESGMTKLITVTNYYTLTSEASMASYVLATGTCAVSTLQPTHTRARRQVSLNKRPSPPCGGFSAPHLTAQHDQAPCPSPWTPRSGAPTRAAW